MSISLSNELINFVHLKYGLCSNLLRVVLKLSYGGFKISSDHSRISEWKVVDCLTNDETLLTEISEALTLMCHKGKSYSETQCFES